MNKKYTLLKTDTNESWDGKILFRIKAKVAFGTVLKGELGGYIEAEVNLGISGDAWVYGDAWVSGEADLLVITPIGSRKGTLTFTKSDMSAATGCFRGTIEAFAKAVVKTHGDNQHARAYLKAIELAKIVFGLGC